MRTALDSNVVSGLLSKEPQTQTIVAQLGRCKQEGPILISPIVYAELLAYPRISPPFLSFFLEKTGIHVEYDLDPSIWNEAGIRFGKYAERRRTATQEHPRRLIADFLIGAHALAHADRLMTFDTAIYRRNFPELRLYEGLN